MGLKHNRSVFSLNALGMVKLHHSYIVCSQSWVTSPRALTVLFSVKWIFYRNAGQVQATGKKKRLKPIGKLYYAIDLTKKAPHFCTAECKILHSLMLSFVDKFGLSVAL